MFKFIVLLSGNREFELFLPGALIRKITVQKLLQNQFEPGCRPRFARNKTHHVCHTPNFAEKTFADGRKSAKFAMVFSLESFLLYGRPPSDPQQYQEAHEISWPTSHKGSRALVTSPGYL